MKPPSTKDYVLMMLVLLMTAHLTVLGFGAASCDERSDRGQQIGIGIANLDNTNTPTIAGVNLRVFGGYYGV